MSLEMNKLVKKFPPILKNNLKGYQANRRNFDSVVINCVGGKGGDGFMMFRRERDQPMMGPDGGNGGNGGHVIIKGCSKVKDLCHLEGVKKVECDRADRGKRHAFAGARSNHKYVNVPIGTIVIDVTDEDNEKLLDFIHKNDQECLAAHGGFGGYGNKQFQCPEGTFPHTMVPSSQLRPLDDKMIKLVCVNIAQIVLLGLENAGKSSILQYYTNNNFLGSEEALAVGDMNTLRQKYGLNVSMCETLNFESNKELALKYTTFAHKTCIVLNTNDPESVDFMSEIYHELPKMAKEKMIFILNHVEENEYLDFILEEYATHFSSTPLYNFPLELAKFETDMNEYFLSLVKVKKKLASFRTAEPRQIAA